MKNTLVYFLALFCLLSLNLKAQYAPVGNRICTQWSEKMDVNRVHSEYPRPLMVREHWKNLNGLWNYVITDKNTSTPSDYQGQILVPFAIESSLSGVGKTLGADKYLWYERKFTIPSNWNKERVLLHFGAVDWQADVWVNDIKVGSHTGGYTPFSFDITQALSKNNKLRIRVYDPTDKGYQPRGKQVSKSKGIWYTAVSGIWQTVWLEPVPQIHIQSLKTVPDIDNHSITVDALSSNTDASCITQVKVFDNGRLVASAKSLNNAKVEIPMPADMKLWSPDSPFLYTMEVSLVRNGKTVDKVDSYVGMRKVSSKQDADGIYRIMLNNKPLFQFGPLDQGWWPDGLYTAPSYEAMIYDIDKTKSWGFNMIRKHVKVEPATWYAYCDKVGILVWQDMPSGDMGPSWQQHNYFNGAEAVRSFASESNYRREWKEIMDLTYSNPSVVVWVPFNEAWGQFKTQEISDWTKCYDPSRLVNSASGGNFYHCGDILDLHNYPSPKMYLFDAKRVNVLGEYGGIGFPVKDHLWTNDKNWGYIQFKSEKEVTDEYVKYANQLLDFVKRGFSAAVYTQTTDVEIEVNGIMTYDRKVIKMEEDRVRKINQEICHSLSH